MNAPQDQLLMQGIDPLLGRRFLVRKRDGRIEEFNEARILLAIESAFKATLGLDPYASLPDHAQTAAKNCAAKVVELVLNRAVRGEELEVESIQDSVEDQLMLAGHLEVARRYILYREKRRIARAQREGRLKPSPSIPETSSPPAAATDPLLPELRSIYRQALPRQRDAEKFEDVCRRHFDGCLNEGDYWRRLSPDLLEYDSDCLARALLSDRDQHLAAAQLDALREHYLLRENGRCLETPQYFWMRVAMGLALNEIQRREARALDFYEALSTFRFIPSDLILSHAGTPRPSLAGGSEAAPPGSWTEPWRRDILDSLHSNKLWLPDLFMQRVRQQASWTLFDPDETADLHDCCGRQFQTRYLAYERKAAEGAMRFAKPVQAAALWHEIVASTARTGQAWLGFKDAVGLRSPRPHHESAACPLGAINLAAHISETTGGLDAALLSGTITSAVRMLDNAVDLNLYPTPQARLGTLKHRAIGLGIAGFQEALHRLHLHHDSAAAADFAGESMEKVSRLAIMASAELARERGPFPAYAGSQWHDGILPPDTLDQLSRERGLRVDVPPGASQDWDSAREAIRLHGMRNCATTAISPLGAPAQIAGLAPSIEDPLPGGELDPAWTIECAARRQQWTDLGETLTLRTSEKNPCKLAGLYMQAWEKGIKTLRHDHQPAPPSQEPKPIEAAALA